MNPSSPRSPFSILKNTVLRLSRNNCGVCTHNVKTGLGTAIYTAECSHLFMTEKGAAPLLPPPRNGGSAIADFLLRFTLFSSCVEGVLVMVTSNETRLVQIPFPPFLMISREAKFVHSPAFVYFVAALSAAGLYAIITTLVSFIALFRRGCYHKLVPHFLIFDVIFLGIMAAATGAAGAVAYIGLKGNDHVNWNEICNIYDTFCKHVGSSVAVSLVGCVVLVLLVIVSVRSLCGRIPK